METGEKVVLFKPLETYETPSAIEAICEKYQKAQEKELVDELILISCFLLDYLCIHPFNDGNGRMSRLLILLLLYRSGYMVGQYISIEKAIADTKEAYYDALQKSDRGWHEGTNDPKPFVRYMLSIILSCYKEFEARVSIAHAAGAKSTSYDIVKVYVRERIGTFSKQDVLIGLSKPGKFFCRISVKGACRGWHASEICAGRKTLYVRADAVIN